MRFSSSSILVLLLLLLLLGACSVVTATLPQKGGGKKLALSNDEIALLNDVLDQYPELLDVDAFEMLQYLNLYKKTNKNSKKKSSKGGKYYEPLPRDDNVGRQHGRCDEVFVSREGEQHRWLQGHTNITAGSATFFLHFSASCDGCLDVLQKVNELYVAYRARGLNVVAVHSSPFGYLPSEEDDADMLRIMNEQKLAFPVVSVGSKKGIPPTLRNGMIDVKRAKKASTSQHSLYRWLYGDLNFSTPIAVIYKNCLAMQEQPSTGYTIMGLRGSVGRASADLLWPEGSSSDSAAQVARLEATLVEFGISEDELGLPLKEEEEVGKGGGGGGGRRRKRKATKAAATSSSSPSPSRSPRTEQSEEEDEGSSVDDDDDDDDEEEEEEEVGRGRRRRRRAEL